LQEGDVIKFGRYKATVAQICLAGEHQIPKLSGVKDCDEPISIPQNASILAGEELARSDSMPRCRICLGDALDETPGEEQSALIQVPCLCKGSNGMVHISCLERWLAPRCGLEDLRGDGQYLSWTPPCCEVCKTELPVTVPVSAGLEADKVSLLPALPPKVWLRCLPGLAADKVFIAPPFIVLSMPKSDARPFGERFIFAPSQDNTELKIGRSNLAQLRVKDVSVSRLHATVTLTNGAFVLKDNGARFQTALQATSSQIRLPPLQDTVSKVQLGRTVLDMKLLAPLDE
jgi:pSer/pThr/pTyr-binding forkhead associated (FHA) protein